MAMGEFAYAMDGNRFLAAPPLTDPPFAVVGVPYDGAVTNRPGARFGPGGIRRASLMLCYTARDLRGLDDAALQPAIDTILARVGNLPCYLTLDIDCLDPAFAPGTGTPEPGGLSSSQFLSFIAGLAPLNTVAMDCVETAPAYDHAELTTNVAATCVWTHLCGQVQRRQAAQPAGQGRL